MDGTPTNPLGSGDDTRFGGLGDDLLLFNSSGATTFNFGSSSGAFLGVYGTTGGALFHDFGGIEQFQMTDAGNETFIGYDLYDLSIDGGASHTNVWTNIENLIDFGTVLITIT